MLAFVTVGSTRFDALVEAALSRPVLQALAKKGFTRLVIQCGKSATEFDTNDQNGGVCHSTIHGIEIEAWAYKPDIRNEYTAAQLVISHAGSGTIIDVLRLGKPLIVAPNPSLLDNHQEELACELEKLGYLKASTPRSLALDILSFDVNVLNPFPPKASSEFVNLLDQEMGFV